MRRFWQRPGKAEFAEVVKLPHGDCKARKQAMLRVAEHCPVHETIVTLGGVDLVVLDRSELVPA